MLSNKKQILTHVQKSIENKLGIINKIKKITFKAYMFSRVSHHNNFEMNEISSVFVKSAIFL